MVDSLKINSIESFYRALNGQNEIKTKASLMLVLRNWLTEVLEFDPVSGLALHTGIIDFLDTVVKSVQNKPSESEIKDRIYRIVSHTEEAVLAIMEHTRDKILREHAIVPIHAAREVDSSSVQWLSRQPGRTLREKLSGKPYIKAVRRRTSFDTAENRLLKAFLFRLEQILIERQSALAEPAESTCEKLLVSLQRWLRSEDASEIGIWENLPPNNILLQDKHYRKIWDGWLWLQAIDEQIARDSERVNQDILSVIYWSTLSLLNHSDHFRTVQQLLTFNYDEFYIHPKYHKLPIGGYSFFIKGKIKFIKPNKSFGCIVSDDGRSLYFSPYNLSPQLDINSLSIGDEVYFIIGNNRKGECANNICLIEEIIPVYFDLSDDIWKIQINEDKYFLKIVSGSLVVGNAQERKIERKIKIDTENIVDIPKTILSLIIGHSFEYHENISNKYATIPIYMSIVDLCSIRPMISNNDESPKYLPFRLLMQYWSNIDENVEINCCYAKAIVLNSDVETISMRSLFSNSSMLSDSTKSSASMYFSKKLSEYIKTDKLTYIVPDWCDDFDIEKIRKSINYYFVDSLPIPKSIAAVFAWQSSNKFRKLESEIDGSIDYEDNRVLGCDFVMVVDSFEEGISITPVKAIYNRDLEKILPESQGILWERHPTIIVRISEIYDDIVNNLDKNDCKISKELINLFGFDGLMSDAGKLSFLKNNYLYNLPDSIQDYLNNDLDISKILNESIVNFLESIENGCGPISLFVINLDSTLRKPDLMQNYKWIGTVYSPIEGCRILNKWQDKVGDIALWTDHLPDLSMEDIVRDGHYENFSLVKDATVTPKRGKPVDIQVEDMFILPAGRTDYSFHLRKGNEKLKFVAYLKSSSFPLKKDTLCKLKMTYTYGINKPYELKFIPLDSAEAGFQYIRVEWRSVSEERTVDLDNLPIPDFPARKNWSDFPVNLLERVKQSMKNISDIVRYGRISGTILKWYDKGDDNVFCFIDNVFVHKSRLNVEHELPRPGDLLSFYKIEKGEGKFVAEDIVIGNSQPTRCFLANNLRSPVLTIWNHGHSLSEADAPNHFRNAIFEGIQNALSIIESENMPDILKKELFFFLCCLHKDAPEIVGTKLLNAVKNKTLFNENHKDIAFAIGDADLPYQQELLEYVINDNTLSRSNAMIVLSIALWRSETLIFKISETELKKICKDLFECILKTINDKRIAYLRNYLELLLALIRSRKNKKYRTILFPDNEITQNYVDLIDKVKTMVNNDGIKLKSRISLQIDKPESFRDTPDLLYALRMYLTGDSGANTILISRVNDVGSELGPEE